MTIRTIVCAALLLSCRPAAPPCSKVALTTAMAECEVRIRLHCAKGDKTCSEYQECKKAVKEWRECPAVGQ